MAGSNPSKIFRGGDQLVTQGPYRLPPITAPAPHGRTTTGAGGWPILPPITQILKHLGNEGPQTDPHRALSLPKERSGSYAGRSSNDKKKKRKLFLKQLMSSERSRQKGYIVCTLCNFECWAPNGRYHMEKCKVLRQKRIQDRLAQKHGTYTGKSVVNGIVVDEELFEKPDLSLKKASIPGFVLASSGGDPLDLAQYEEKRKKRGFVICCKCDDMIWAPNMTRHAAKCFSS